MAGKDSRYLIRVQVQRYVAKLSGVLAGDNINSFTKGCFAPWCRRMMNMVPWLTKLQRKTNRLGKKKKKVKDMYRGENFYSV